MELGHVRHFVAIAGPDWASHKPDRRGRAEGSETVLDPTHRHERSTVRELTDAPSAHSAKACGRARHVGTCPGASPVANGGPSSSRQPRSRGRLGTRATASSSKACVRPRRYGLNDSPVHSHREIAQWLGVGEERSRQIEREAPSPAALDLRPVGGDCRRRLRRPASARAIGQQRPELVA